VTSRDEVMTSSHGVDDVRGVGDDDAKSFDDYSYYYSEDDDTDSDKQYDDNYDEYKSHSWPSPSYPEPDKYAEQEYDEMQHYYQPQAKKKKKKTYVPVFVPEKEKKKSELNIIVTVKKCKLLPCSSPSVGPGADPGMQAVSRQVALNHPPSGGLPLLSARPAVTFPAEERHHPSDSTELQCLTTETRKCEQLAEGCYSTVRQSDSHTRPQSNQSDALATKLSSHPMSQYLI